MSKTLKTPTQQQFDELKKHILGIKKLEQQLGRPLLYNLGYRELFQEQEVKSFYNNYQPLSKTSSGPDATSSNFKKIEAKSRKYKRKSNSKRYDPKNGFEFDKQNDPIRRRQTLEYDSYFFTAFDHEQEFPICTALALTPQAISGVRAFLKGEQAKFVKRLDEVTERGNRINRDSIRISIQDLLNIQGITWAINGAQVSRSKILEMF